MHDVFEDYIWVLLSIDSDQLDLVLIVNQLPKGTVLKQLLLNMRMLILWLVHQPSQDAVVQDSLLQHVVVLVRDGVETSLLQLLVDQVVWHFKSDEQVGLLVEFFQHADLIVGGRSTLQDPTVGPAVWGTQPLLQEVHGDVVWDRFTLGDDLS